MNEVPISSGSEPSSSAASHVHSLFRSLQIKTQYFLDQVTPHYYGRWSCTIILLIGFIVRFLVAQRWYIVAYALAIYLLNIFLAFLTPRFDPALEAMEQEELDNESGFSLPTRSDEEFRPFIRRLPEFKFW